MPLRVVTFKIDDDLLERLDRYARSKRISRSEAIRLAILKLLKEEEPGAPTTPKIIRIYG